MAILALKRNYELNDAMNVERPDCPSAKNPVDLVHLSRQTLGERSLEVEVLTIFKNQSTLYIDRLENAVTADERRLAAHTILGSARSLGAWRVAKHAEKVQQAGKRHCDISKLKSAVEEANSYICELLN